MDPELFTIINAAPGSLSPVSGRDTALASAFLSPTGGVGTPRPSPAASSEPTLEWGPSLLLIRDHTRICGGQYGHKKNNCFCCVERGGSKTCPSRHRQLKHPLLANAAASPEKARIYYHKGSGSDAVYAAPSLEATGWTPKALSQLLGRSFASWEAWREEVAVLAAAQDSNQDAGIVRTAVKTTRTLPRLDRKMVAIVDGSDELGLELEDRLRLLSSAVDELERLDELKAEPGWETLGEGERKNVTARINLLQAAMKELHELMVGGVKELQLGFGIRLRSVEFLIGSFSSPELREAFEGSSVMGIIEDMQGQLDAVKSTEHVQALARQILQTEVMTAQTDGVKVAFKTVMHRLVTLEEELARTNRENQRPPEAADMSTHSWMDMMEVPAGAHAGRGKDDVLASIQTRLTALEQTMTPEGKSDGEDLTVSFMGVRFSSEDDVRTYVESLCDGKFEVRPGLVMDCYAMFHTLNREIFDTKGKLSMVDLAKVRSLDMSQSDVYHILAASEHGLPDFFDAPSSSHKIYIDGKQGKKFRFGNIPSYAVWGPVGTVHETVRKQAEGSLTRLVRTKKLDLKEVRSPELRAFLLAMLEASKDFVEAVFTFLTEEHSALNDHFPDEGLCWDFACSCVEHVFKYEFEAARAIIHNPDVGNPALYPKVLWQALRTISVQESFMRVGFKNHSSLSSAYSRFLLTQYQRSSQELAKATKELESQKRKLEELTAHVEGVDKRARGAESAAAAAKNAVQAANRRPGGGGGT
jgi:hypothetical protein